MTKQEQIDVLREELEYALRLLAHSRLLHEESIINCTDRASLQLQSDKITMFSKKCSDNRVLNAIIG